MSTEEACGGCGSSEKPLYLSSCRHMTLCMGCGKSMAENQAKCRHCEIPVTRLIKEYNVFPPREEGKNYVLAAYAKDEVAPETGTKFSFEKNTEGRPRIIKSEDGNLRYEGFLREPDSKYFILIFKDGQFVASPVNTWLDMKRVPDVEQPTLNQAENALQENLRFARE